jgi:hypothetical protein
MAASEFVKLLGAESFFGDFIAVPVIKIVKFTEKMINHPQ